MHPFFFERNMHPFFLTNRWSLEIVYVSTAMQPINKCPAAKGRDKPICSEEQVNITLGKYFQLQIN
jgi:hypothetical protein